ncbi:MAG: FkbM family methyltransferase [Bacteroidetes bacterium]|nr:FkbM family methyltransferase [Bacteroidota bacterium]
MNIFERSFWNKVRLHIKDTAFTHPYEHLIRAIRIANQQGLGKSFAGSIIDVGAYDGKTALFFNNYFPNATIHAFEPNPRAIQLLEKSVNDISKIQTHHLALSSKEGSVPLYVTHNEVSSSLHNTDTSSKDASAILAEQLQVKEVISIKSSTLDSFNFSDILFLKLDTQGNEIKVLEGATESVRKSRFVITEMSVHTLYEGGCMYYETDEKLRNAGFEPVDFIVPSRKNGVQMTEFDAIYRNTNL